MSVCFIFAVLSLDLNDNAKVRLPQKIAFRSTGCKSSFPFALAVIVFFFFLFVISSLFPMLCYVMSGLQKKKFDLVSDKIDLLRP